MFIIGFGINRKEELYRMKYQIIKNHQHMKYIFNFILLAPICFCINPKKTNAQSPLHIEEIQTVLFIAADSSYMNLSQIKRLNKSDADSLIQVIFNSLFSGKLIAYENYPNKELSYLEVYNKLTPWDSTHVVEHPDSPGVFVNAPIKNETNAQDIPFIIFHEVLDTLKLERKTSYITLYRYISTQKTGITGIRKLFDIGLP